MIDDTEIKIVRICTEDISNPKNYESKDPLRYIVPLELSREPSNAWIEIFESAWEASHKYNPFRLITQVSASVYKDRITLYNTTLDEVEEHHKEALKMCMDTARKNEKGRQEKEKEHRKYVKDRAKEIKF